MEEAAAAFTPIKPCAAKVSKSMITHLTAATIYAEARTRCFIQTPVC